MILRELAMENFGPYVGTTEVTFPESGVIVVHGKNGFGKTALLNALTWCLYGTVYDRSGSPIGDEEFFNYNARDDGAPRFTVALAFTHEDRSGETHVYRLRRIAQAPGGKAKPNKDGHLDLDQVLDIEIDGVIRNANIFDDVVNEVLPSGVSRFFLFDGEMIRDYEDLLDDDVSGSAILVKQSIEMVLGVPSATRGKDDIDAVIAEFDKQYAAQLRKTKGSKKAGDDLEKLTSERDRQREQLAEAKKLEESSSKRLKEAQSYLAKVDQYKEDAKILRSVDAGLNDIEEQRAAWRERRREDATRLWQDVINPRVQARLDELDQEIEDLARADAEVDAADRLLQDLKKSIGDRKCTTCHQPLPKKEMDRLDKAVADAEAQLADARQTANPGRLEEVRQASAVLRKIVPAGVASGIRSVETEMRRSVVQEKKLRSAKQQALERLKGQDDKVIAKYEKEEDLFRTSKAKAAILIKEHGDRIAEIETEITKLKALVKKDHRPEMVRLETTLEFLREVRDYFGESIDILIERMRSAVEDGANAAFEAISGTDLYDGLAINENYGLTLFDKQGYAAKMRSEGYKQVVAMSLIASLNRNAAVQAPLVMDTPFGRLDPDHTTGIIKHCIAMADQVILLVQPGEIDEGDFDVIRSQISMEMDIDHIDATRSRLVTRSAV